ncbi:unnamed protein product [Heterobilharzia americana]|nr:unnamed protein product [Heterobilharzia americana]
MAVIEQAESQASKDEELESVWLKLDKEYSNTFSSRVENNEEDIVHESPAVSIASELCPRIVELLGQVIKETESKSNNNLSSDIIGPKVAEITRQLLLDKPNNLPTDILLSLV